MKKNIMIGSAVAVALFGAGVATWAINDGKPIERTEFSSNKSSSDSKSNSSNSAASDSRSSSDNNEVGQSEQPQQSVPQSSSPAPQPQQAPAGMMTTREQRAMAETGMNYNAHLDGTYIGAYGFYRGTWNSEAAEAKLDPTDFSPENQDRMADYHAQKHYGGGYGYFGSGW